MEKTASKLKITDGIRRRTNPFLPGDGLYSLKNFHFNEYGSLTKWQGFSKYNGTVLTETGNAIFTGLFDFVKSNQTRYKVATGRTGVYLYGTPTANEWNSLSLSGAGGARTGTADDLYDFIVLKDMLYLCNGIDVNLRFDGSTVYRMGITAPSAAPSAATNGAGVLSGNYSYRVTFYNSSLGHESNPSAASNTVSTSSNQIRLSSLPTTTDPQVDKYRIYRTTTGGGIYSYLAEIAIASTYYDDNLSDSNLGTAVELTGNGVPPIAAMMIVHKGYTFFVPKNSSRISFSKQNYPNAVDSNDFRDLDPNDNDVITGLSIIHGHLVVSKNDSIWNGYGDDRTTFGFTRQVTGRGSTNHKGMVSIPELDKLFYMGESGIASYNGAVSLPESLEIGPIVKGLNQARLKNSYGFVYKPLNLACWLVSDGVSAENDLILTYDYISNSWGQRPIPNTHGNVAAIFEDSSNNEYFHIGGYGGYVWQGDSGLSDDGSSISCEVIDKALPDIVSDNVKIFTELVVYFKPQASVTMSAYYAIDDPDGTYVLIDTVDVSKASGVQRLKRFNAQGRRIYIKFTHSAIGQPLIIRGWEVKYTYTGRVY